MRYPKKLHSIIILQQYRVESMLHSKYQNKIDISDNKTKAYYDNMR